MTSDNADRDTIDYTGSDAPVEEVGEYSQALDTSDASTTDQSGEASAALGQDSANIGVGGGQSPQTGRIDVADSGMGTGVNAGTGTFSRDESDGMLDRPEDSTLKGSEDPGGAFMYPDQTGGTPDEG